MYSYTPDEWILFFFSYCFLGWCFECAVVSIEKRRFVNRGFLRGPLLPIYGAGAVAILWAALPFRHQVVAVFFVGMATATVLEYGTGFCMERLFQVKYWDYSGQKFQLNGYICLRSSLAWGGLSVALTEVIHPPLEHMLLRMSASVTLALSAVLLAAFAADLGYSCRTALDFANMLRELTRLRNQAGRLREQLAAAAEEARARLEADAEEARARLEADAGQTRARLDETVDETRIRLEQAAAEAREKLQTGLAQRRVGLQDSLDRNHEAYEGLIRRFTWAHRQLLRGNPSAASSKFGEVLRELKGRLPR